MILAAGLGTRLRPLTLDRPKPLLDVHGRPLIEYNLLLLRRYGIVDVIINLHHQGDALRAALGSGDTLGVRIVYSPEDPLLDTGGAIKNAASLLGDDDFLVLNGDTIIDLPLDALLAAHRARRAAATLVLRHDPEQQRYGLVEIDGEERIRRFLGRPAEVDTALVPYMFAGVHVLSSRFRSPDSGASSTRRRISRAPTPSSRSDRRCTSCETVRRVALTHRIKSSLKSSLLTLCVLLGYGAVKFPIRGAESHRFPREHGNVAHGGSGTQLAASRWREEWLAEREWTIQSADDVRRPHHGGEGRRTTIPTLGICGACAVAIRTSPATSNG